MAGRASGHNGRSRILLTSLSDNTSLLTPAPIPVTLAYMTQELDTLTPAEIEAGYYVQDGHVWQADERTPGSRHVRAWQETHPLKSGTRVIVHHLEMGEEVTEPATIERPWLDGGPHWYLVHFDESGSNLYRRFVLPEHKQP